MVHSFLRTNRRLSRRTMLRGVGVSMALPWLESLPVWGATNETADGATQPPVRFGCLFSGNGFHIFFITRKYLSPKRNVEILSRKRKTIFFSVTKFQKISP